jgi:hypothetical protein
MHIEKLPSAVGVERINTEGPVLIYDSQGLHVRRGIVDVPAIAFEGSELLDPVKSVCDGIIRIIGAERIDRIVVYERQPLTKFERKTGRHETPLLEPQTIYCGRYGFVAYLK